MQLVLVALGGGEGGNEFLLGGHAHADGGGAGGIERARQFGVAPHLQIVVGAVLVQFAFDEIAVVVDDHDDGGAALADQGGEFLRGHLQRAVAGQHDRALAGPGQPDAQRGGRAVSDGRVVGLHDEVLGLLDREFGRGAERIAGLGQQHHVVVEEPVQAFVEARRGQLARGPRREDRLERPPRRGMRLEVGPRPQRGGQRADEIAQLHAVVDAGTDAHPASAGGHDAAFVEVHAEEPGVQIGHPDPEREQAIRVLDLPTHAFPTPAALVDAGELRMELRQQALAAEHRGEGDLDRLDETQRVGSEPLPRQLHADQRHGMGRAVEPPGHLGHAFGQNRRIGRGDGRNQVGRGATARRARHVGGQFEVARQFAGHALRDDAVDLRRRGFGIGQERGGGGDLPEDLQLELIVGHEMVHQRARLPAPRGRGAGHHDQRYLLGIGACHGVDDAQSAHPVRHHGPADAVHARVAVGRVTGVQLVARAHPSDGTGQDLVEEIQHVVAGHAKQMPDSGLVQAIQNIARDRINLFHSRSPLPDSVATAPGNIKPRTGDQEPATGPVCRRLSISGSSGSGHRASSLPSSSSGEFGPRPPLARTAIRLAIDFPRSKGVK